MIPLCILHDSITVFSCKGQVIMEKIENERKGNTRRIYYVETHGNTMQAEQDFKKDVFKDP